VAGGRKKIIEIRHRETGAVLHRIEAHSLERASLPGTNLSDADLTGMNLAGADLTGALFRNTTLREANLSRANLTGAYLFQTDLGRANLSGALLYPCGLDGADLSGANLTGANLTGAYLADAKLIGAKLSYANLQSCYLGGADLTGAQAAFTLFADCPSLVDARGLDQIEHLGPSSLDLRTLRAGIHRFPDLFLRGVGLAREEMDALRAAYDGPMPPHSYLLAHGEADGDLARRLRADLLGRGVSLWPCNPDLEAGYLLQIVFSLALQRHDGLLLICSRSSLLQSEIADRVAALLRRERETGTQKLFPLYVDDFLLSAELLRLADQKMASGEWRDDWVRHLREHPGLDFRRWTDTACYQTQLPSLAAALRQPAARRSAGPQPSTSS
jgi:hypothetical protein